MDYKIKVNLFKNMDFHDGSMSFGYEKAAEIANRILAERGYMMGSDLVVPECVTLEAVAQPEHNGRPGLCLDPEIEITEDAPVDANAERGRLPG
jgi:hypothetical protein